MRSSRFVSITLSALMISGSKVNQTLSFRIMRRLRRGVQMVLVGRKFLIIRQEGDPAGKLRQDKQGLSGLFVFGFLVRELNMAVADNQYCHAK